ncbi:MAG: cytosine deaminase [Hyphomicrobiaceae bacterium]
MKERLLIAARSGRFRVARARIPRCALTDASGLPEAGDGLVAADIVIADGRVESVDPPGTPSTEPVCNVSGSMIWPGLVDCHTHLDKAHIWPRAANPDGTFQGAIDAAWSDQERSWTADDLRKRMDFALRSAYAYGTVAIRTHIDTGRERLATTWGVLREIQAEWRGRIAVQPVAFLSLADLSDETFMARVLAEQRATPGAVIGAFIEAFPEHQSGLRDGLARLIAYADGAGSAIDLHVDETIDQASNGLEVTAESVLAAGFDGPVVCGHCCALSAYDEDRRRSTIDRVAEAGIGIVSLPLCNAYLQDRSAGRTPRLRATAPVHELAAAGIPVAIASDNVRDPFYAYGDLDLIEVFRTALRLQHLDHPVADWPASIAATAGKLMGLIDVGRIVPGNPADLIVMRARGWSELIARPQSDRVVVRHGMPIAETPPDYRELDQLEGYENATHF